MVNDLDRETKITVKNRFGGRCAYCGREFAQTHNLTIDHIIPKSYFTVAMSFRKDMPDIPSFLRERFIAGMKADDRANLLPMCKDCNELKANHPLDKFRAVILQKKLEISSTSRFKMMERYGLLRDVDRTVVFYFETDGVSRETQED